MKLLLILALTMSTSVAVAKSKAIQRTIRVQILYIPTNEEKNFRFSSSSISTESAVLQIDSKVIACDVAYTAEKDWAEVGCTPLAKDAFRRFFTRVACGYDREALLLLNEGGWKDGDTLKGHSISVTCN